MNEKVLLSICISSYNKGLKCRDLVNKLCGLNDDRINIIICDDGSDQETIEILKSISDDRVIVYYNPINLGACPNWYETINHGNGKYILHVLDRDYIDIGILKDFINYIKNADVGVGYIGNFYSDVSQTIAKGRIGKYPAGEKTAAMVGGIPLHPTGFFIKKEKWNANEFRSFFYEEKLYGIYPHSYLMGIIGISSDVLLYRMIFCRYVYSQTSRSFFYKKKERVKFWWEPGSIIETSKKMLSVLCGYFNHNSNKSALIINVFSDAIFRGTIGYQREMIDKRQMAHYSLKTKDVTVDKLLAVNLRYTFEYILFLVKLGCCDRSTILEISKIAKENRKRIIRNNKRINIRDESNKKQRFYDVFYKWVKLSNEGKIVSEYFVEHNYRRIAIYGMKELGELLYDEIEKSKDVTVVCGIDQNYGMQFKDLRMYTPYDELPDIDVIVVTAVHYFNEIEDLIQRKVSCPVISIEDVLYWI